MMPSRIPLNITGPLELTLFIGDDVVHLALEDERCFVRWADHTSIEPIDIIISGFTFNCSSMVEVSNPYPVGCSPLSMYAQVWRDTGN